MPDPSPAADAPYVPAPELQKVLADLKEVGNPLDTLTPASAPRVWMMREVLARNIIAPIPVDNIRELCIPARNHVIPIRIYTPADKRLASADGRLPVVLFFHGGGWTLGSIIAYDSLTRYLASNIPAIVVSAGYRLAPECPYPAAVDDAHLALEWLARNIKDIGGDPQRVALAGDSAGGTLATVMALRACKEQPPIPIAFQALFYPSVHIASTDYPSYRQYGEEHWLTLTAIKNFRGLYLPNHRDWASPDASPLLTPDEDLKLMPPTFILTCGCDVLRDEGEAYAKRFQRHGVPVIYRLEPEMIHACLSLYNSALYPAASKRVEPVLAAITQVLGENLAPRARPTII